MLYVVLVAAFAWVLVVAQRWYDLTTAEQIMERCVRIWQRLHGPVTGVVYPEWVVEPIRTGWAARIMNVNSNAGFERAHGSSRVTAALNLLYLLTLQLPNPTVSSDATTATGA